jgi:hypothetical protein
MLESLDLEEQLLWKKARWMMRKSTPSTPVVTPEELALLNSKKAEALADSTDAQFRLVNRTVETGSHEMVEAKQAYFFLLQDSLS